MLRWDEINNQLYDIIVALIQEVILWFHPHKTCSQPIVRSTRCHRALSHLRWQRAYRNSVPPVVVADLQTLGHTLYQCLLSCHSFGPHHRFCLTQWVRLPVPLHVMPHQVVRHKSMLSNVTRHLIYSDNILLFWHLLRRHFASRRWPAKGSFRKFFATSNHSAKCAPLSLNLSYITHRSSAIFNTIGPLREGNLVFTVKVVELDGWQKSFNSTKVPNLQHEFTVYVFSSSWNNWNYVCLSNLIGTKNVTSSF
jgi:hypothetical protein